MSETHGNPSDHPHAPPALPEPTTPMWLTALGAVLFLIVGLIWGLTPDPANGAGADTKADTPAAR